MKNLTQILFTLILVFLISNISNAQSYSKVKITKKDGITIEGRNAMIGNGSVAVMEGALQRTYDLNDILYIQAKEGKAAKWALGCGGGCLGVCIIAGAANGADGIEEAGGTVSQYIGGSILWTGIFAGVGAIIGAASDKYENVYTNTNTGLLRERIKLDLTSTQYADYNLTLSYRF